MDIQPGTNYLADDQADETLGGFSRHEAAAIEEQSRNRRAPIGRHEAVAIAKHSQMVEHHEMAARLLHDAQQAIARSLMTTGKYSPELDAEVAAHERRMAVATSAAAMAADAIVQARKRDREEAHAARTEKLTDTLREREAIASEIQRIAGQLAMQIQAMEKANGRMIGLVGIRSALLTPQGHWTSEALHSAATAGEVAKRSTAAVMAGHLIERQYQRETVEVLKFHELLFQHTPQDEPEALPLEE